MACSNTLVGIGWPGNDVEVGRGIEFEIEDVMGGGPIAKAISYRKKESRYLHYR